jgi:hypothetical protein
MYNIDNRGLRSAIGISLVPSIKKEEKLEDRITFYFTIALDMIVGALNSSSKDIATALDEQFERFPNDDALPLLGEILDEELRNIKKQFILAGFDQRLQYKLVSRELPRSTIKIFGIAMDLEATVSSLTGNEYNHEKHISSTSEAVSENPTIEQLAELFDYH